MGVSLGRSVLLVILAALLMLSMAAIVAASPADAAVRQCKKLDKKSHVVKCYERHPDGVR
jgi:hypothetical protein